MGVRVRRAQESDRDLVVRLLDESFRDDPVSNWVFPGEEHRLARHAGLMGVFTDVTLAEGYIDLAEDGSAVALWMDMPDAPHDGAGGEGHEGHEGHGGEGDQDDVPAQVRAVVDPDNERVEQIARWTTEIHPEGRAHVYLWMIGVAPGRQGEGLGTALMAPVLERCDREGLPAYLEASNPRSRALYERLGFVFTGTALDLPDGPSMWPMWREPQAG
ncbi:GNAT family N-acetyltransferase [Streptomyces longispororuber]|uniref:GNAT family N-acetyltransferase n=1 Tax=Streptomyces longispororuber TaxID=68230 RepID=UPI00210E27FD|nr:GNAT family N-acetyltransferase [Streptomyces longispororuber]MCQ4208396.1 GNAT family N-acetyltransferase [Streptomyces longispororuber]